eukprot:9467208-Pyramimonas_sp.AAC.2
MYSSSLALEHAHQAPHRVDWSARGKEERLADEGSVPWRSGLRRGAGGQESERRAIFVIFRSRSGTGLV